MSSAEKRFTAEDAKIAEKENANENAGVRNDFLGRRR